MFWIAEVYIRTLLSFSFLIHKLYFLIMSPHSVTRSTLSSLAVVVAAVSVALAQPDPADPTPLVDKHYQYPDGIVSMTAAPSTWLMSSSAIPSRLQHSSHSWSSSRIQHLQLDHREPELDVSDLVRQPHRRYALLLYVLVASSTDLHQISASGRLPSRTRPSATRKQRRLHGARSPATERASFRMVLSKVSR